MLSKGCLGVGVDLAMYNSLMLCYTRRYEPQKALKIFQDMQDSGMKPDVVCYTTLINAFKNSKSVEKVRNFPCSLVSRIIVPLGLGII